MKPLTDADLDLNGRINLRGLVAAWQRITQERFQDELSRKLYGSRTTKKKGIQRSSLGANYKFGRGQKNQGLRTNQLRTNWRHQLTGSEANLGSQISFLQYGRFVDMGVGNGVDYALSKYQRNRQNGEPLSRRPVRWYSKRKAYETHRLRELLTQYHIDIPLEVLENALTARVEMTL